MLWIGEVEDAKSMDELITSATITGRPTPDFENLDFKIASGLRKILNGNFKKQVTTAEGTSHSLPTAHWRVCTGCKLKSRKDRNICCMSSLKRRHLAASGMIMANWSWWSKDTSSRKSKVLTSNARNRDEDRPAIEALQAKGNERKRRIKCHKQIREERRYPLDHDKPIMWRSMRIRTWPEQERQREGTTSFTFSDRPTAPKLERWRWRTCWRYTESYWWKSVRESKQTTLYKLQERKLPKGEFTQWLACSWMDNFLIYQWMQIRRHCAHKHTYKLADEKRNAKTKRVSRMAGPNSEWDSVFSRTGMFLEKEKLGPTLGVMQTGSKNQRNQYAPNFEERSIEWTLSMEETARKAARIFHKNVYRPQGSYSEIRHRFFELGPASNASSPPMRLRRREFIPCSLGSFTSCDE